MKKCLFLLILFVFSLSAEKADIVIFSYDRPLQLHALLDSIKKHVKGWESIHVIYRVSNSRFEKAYEQLSSCFSHIKFVGQKNPKYDFKSLVKSVLRQLTAQYVIFAVDDNVVIDSVNFSYCIELLEQTKAYGFYLRLGMNISDQNCTEALPLPPLVPLTEDVFFWKFNEGTGDWAYMNTVDMTLYRKVDVVQDFDGIDFNSPNTLEAHWNKNCNYLNKQGLCFKESKIINIPINRVQEDYDNAHMNLYSTDELLTMLENGMKIDIDDMRGIDNTCSHVFYPVKFVNRQIEKE